MEEEEDEENEEVEEIWGWRGWECRKEMQENDDEGKEDIEEEEEEEYIYKNTYENIECMYNEGIYWTIAAKSRRKKIVWRRYTGIPKEKVCNHFGSFVKWSTAPLRRKMFV